MDDLDSFRKRALSLIKKAESGSVGLFPFLDEASEAVLLELLNSYKHLSYRGYGKIINSDRKRYIVSMYDIYDEDFKISAYKIDYNKKFSTINHRNVLGALMSLGIKREMVGDITITENNDIYVAISDEISDYVVNEFRSIGHTPIELIKTEDEITNVIRYSDKVEFLASLRLDVIISAAFNFSRSEALEYLANGLVYINHVLCQNPSKLVNLDDEISVRHKGMVKLSSIDGKTRSDRIRVTLSRRV